MVQREPCKVIVYKAENELGFCLFILHQALRPFLFYFKNLLFSALILSFDESLSDRSILSSLPSGRIDIDNFKSDRQCKYKTEPRGFRDKNLQTKDSHIPGKLLSYF